MSPRAAPCARSIAATVRDELSSSRNVASPVRHTSAFASGQRAATASNRAGRSAGSSCNAEGPVAECSAHTAARSRCSGMPESAEQAGAAGWLCPLSNWSSRRSGPISGERIQCAFLVTEGRSAASPALCRNSRSRGPWLWTDCRYLLRAAFGFRRVNGGFQISPIAGNSNRRPPGGFAPLASN
jgi:hypothetical protein